MRSQSRTKSFLILLATILIKLLTALLKWWLITKKKFEPRVGAEERLQNSRTGADQERTTGSATQFSRSKWARSTAAGDDDQHKTVNSWNKLETANGGKGRKNVKNFKRELKKNSVHERLYLRMRT